jgi:hypothetical protein
VAYQFTTISESDFGAGIDQQSAENKIQPGFVEDLVNGDPQAQGYISKRVGYQGVAGNIPVRVGRVDYTGTNLCFTLDTSANTAIDLSTVRSSPLLVQGRLSQTCTGDFSTSDASHYYTAFTLDVTTTLYSSPSEQTLVIPAGSHGQGTPYFLPRFHRQTQTSGNTNEFILVNQVAINKTTWDMTVKYTNDTAADISAFITYSKRNAGSYIGAPISIPGNSTVSIPAIGAGTHLQPNFNLQVELWQDDSTSYIQVIPDTVTISTSGTVNITLTNKQSGAITVFPIVTSVPIANTNTETVTFANPQMVIENLPTDFIGASFYVKNNAGLLTQIIPDTINTVVGDTRTTTVTFGFSDEESAQYFIDNQEATFVAYWEDLRVLANKLCVVAADIGATVIADEIPQLTIWGLDHSEIYGANPTSGRPGWVTHLDSYKSADKNTIVAGLGGNLFLANSLPSSITLYPNLRNRVDISIPFHTIGPAFYGLTDVSSRTSGYMKFSGGESNQARVIAVTYVSGNSVTYLLSTPSRSVTGTPILFGSDKLTINGSGWTVNDGTFTVTAVDYSAADTLLVTVTNPDRNSADFNETDSGALAGIFTSQLTLIDTSSFIQNDRLISDLFESGTDLRVIANSGTEITIGNVVDSYILPAGLTIVAERSGKILPLRNLSGTTSVTNLVRGDMCFYSPVNRNLRILAINSNSDEAWNCIGDGETVTLSRLSGDTSRFSVGQTILLVQAGDLSGEHVITSIPTATSLTIASTLQISVAATLVGKTVEIDETLTLSDEANNQITLSVPVRWEPIEAPVNAGDITPDTYVSHFSSDYGDQPIVRSAMASNNLYLTNGVDPVMKMDGTSIYRAGLPRWQPHAFITVDPDPSDMPAGIQGKIEIPNLSVNCTGRSNNKFTITAADENVFYVGQKIVDTGDGASYNIVGISNDNATPAVSAYIAVDRTITHTGGDHPLVGAYTYKYYFHLYAEDVHGNVLVSATTGRNDNTVVLNHPSQVRIRLIGFPAWDNYNYSRLEMQVFRTMADNNTFYRVANVPITFDNNTGYIDIVDSKQDAFFTTSDLDPVVSVLAGAELGTQWSGPLTSEYITSAANKLILGNIKTDPILNIRILQPANEGALDASDFNGKRFLFRKDNTDSLTTTDNSNRTAYEFISSSSTAISAPVVNNGGNSFTITTASAHGLVAGDWVYLTNNQSTNTWQYTSANPNTSHETLVGPAHSFTTGQKVTFYSSSAPGGLISGTTYYVIVYSSTEVQLATTLANALLGTHINITGATSTGILEPQESVRLEYSGWWQVHSATTYTLTILHKHSATYVPNIFDVNTLVRATAGKDVPVWLSTSDRNYGSITGTAVVVENRVVDRLARAINASQRKVDVTIYPEFSPWLIAGAGQDYASGQLIITQPKALNTITELQLPTFNEFLVFSNGVQRLSGETAGTQVTKYSSRIITSYTNYPEIFNNPTAVEDTNSSSTIDVNSADGQEITGIIPFFGESAFGAALRSGIVVVFKTNSIYLVDLAEKAAGRNPVQKIESQGLGCTAPYSIASTRDGIMFANESGIYKLTRSMAVEYIGRKVERVWRNRVNRNALDLAFGHHYGSGSQYKLSVPLDGGTSPGDVIVYSHVREYQGGMGAWSRYSHSPAIGWCNLLSDAFFASTNGRVFSIRRAGDVTDYRDDNLPIYFTATLRALDFGDGGIRKLIHYLIVKFRVLGDANGTTLLTAADLTDNFVAADSFQIDSPLDNTTGLGDANAVKIKTIRFSIDDRKLVFLQVQFVNNTIDEPLEITEVSVRVAGMTDKGITSAART